MKKNILLILSSALVTFGLASCNSNNSKNISEETSLSESTSSSESVSESISSSESVSESTSSSDSSNEFVFEGNVTVDENFDFSNCAKASSTVEQMSALSSYTPTTFQTSTYTKTTTSLGDGVDLVKVNYKLNSTYGSKSITPYCVVVDLNKVDIVAGTKDNSTSKMGRATPLSQAKSWEAANSGKKVIAITNADYFNYDASPSCVNAFVKDGIILKSSHNYDRDDVPVSKPMLFGTSSAGARIAPISTLTNYSENQDATLKNDKMITFLKSDGTFRSEDNTFIYDTGLKKNNLVVLAKQNYTIKVSSGSTVYKYKILQASTSKDGEIKGCIVSKAEAGTRVGLKLTNTDSNYGYLVKGVNKEIDIEVGDYFSLTSNYVTSTGGEWNGYTTILGARHSLVENGVLPTTLARETQNGAQSYCPRTAVGIMPDGKVVIVSIEDLHYGGLSNTCTGLTLVQLGDFMRYFGCYDACNFDGGGSSQLLTKSGLNGLGDYVVKTRSSVSGSTDASKSREVLNTIMVVTK